MQLVDIAKAHRNTQDKRPVAEFFRSAGYKRAMDYLHSVDITEETAVARTPAHRSNPAVAKVHPIIMMEYVRWVDYGKYCSVFLDHYMAHKLMIDRAKDELTRVHNPTGALNG